MAAVIAVYTIAFIATFDVLYDSVQISSIALIGLCGWFYGTRSGLFSIVLFILLNTAVLYLVSGKPYDIMLTYNPIGIILSMIIAISTGLLKESCDKLDALQSSLESRIDEATAELGKLTQELIENDERERIQIGQDLHDGVGQYLTSMLLHCEALGSSLRQAERVEADLAEWMTRRVHKNIQTVRQLSRSLLPIRFPETDLEAAMGEMVAYFSDISTVNVRLKCNGNSADIPTSTAQHLYRIMQEAIERAIYMHKAKTIDAKLISRKHNCKIMLTGSRTAQPPPSDLVSEVMKYRIRAIGGKQDFTTLAKGRFRLECAIDFEGVPG